MSVPENTQYIDCLEDFKQELSKLSKWDLRCLANINKENFISVTEACDPKTDAMVGWEKCTTLAGLVAKNAIPDVTKLTDAETLNLFDNLIAREFATLDGRRIMLGPFACVYLHDVEGLAKANSAVYYFLKSFLATTHIIYSVCGEAPVLENEELMFQCQEVLMLCQAAEIDSTLKGLAEAAEATTNADIKVRLELRVAQVKALMTLFCAHTIDNKDVDNAIADAGKIAADLREKVIASRTATLGAITSDAKIFPDDVRYWLTTNTTSSSTEPDLTEQLGKVAAFYESLAGFTALAAAKNFYEIAAIAEKIALAAPCVLTRPFAYAYIFRDRPTEQGAPRVARGERLLGEKSLRHAVLAYLEADLGAPLYLHLLDGTVAPMSNVHLADVSHYMIACSNGHSGLKTPAAQLAGVQQQVLQTVFRWLELASACVADTIQSALFNAGRHQRRIANRLTDLNNLHNFSWEVDQRIFCARMPQSTITDAALAREMAAAATVLTSFATDLICDAMEKFVRLTMRLGLPTRPELAACTWYLELIATTRVEHLQTIITKAADKGRLVPARKVNGRTGNPLAAPALTSRTPIAALNDALTRADLARQVAEVSFRAFAIFQQHGIVAGFDAEAAEGSAASTSLTTAENMFDHRFSYLSRVRMPALPPYSACAMRLKKLKTVKLFLLVSSLLNNAAEVAAAAKSQSAAAAAGNSPFSDDFAALEQSAAEMTASLSLLKSLLFPNVAANAAAADVADLTSEQVAAALAAYDVSLDAPYDKSVIIPVLRKKE